MSLIVPGDYWILFVSLAVICLLVINKYRVSAYIGLLLTTMVILVRYNPFRALLHVAITVALINIFRILSSRLVAEQIENDE